MLENINEVAILVSALLSLAIGSIWYSPLVFGNHWMKSLGLTKIDEGDEAVVAMFRAAVLAFGASVCIFFVLAKFIVLAQLSETPLTILATYISVLFVASLAYTVIWEKRPLMYYAIHAGYVVLMVCVGIIVIGYWPW